MVVSYECMFLWSLTTIIMPIFSYDIFDINGIRVGYVASKIFKFEDKIKFNRRF